MFPMSKPAVSIDIDQLRDNADEAGQLLKALGNPDRLLLLCQLVAGEMNVGELEDRLKIVQPTLSQQLGVLRREGLVDTRRDGRQIYYSISSPQALAVIETLYQLFCSETE
jgi:ArsR family transcriptional regulator